MTNIATSKSILEYHTTLEKRTYYQHFGYVRNKMTSKATGEYFNLPEHGMNLMKLCILELYAIKSMQYKSSTPFIEAFTKSLRALFIY